MNIDSMISKAHMNLMDAIEEWEPSKIICAFSGGHDSMVTTDIVMRMKLPVPVEACSVDTGLTLDGWKRWVESVALEMGWSHKFYDGDFEAYCKWVKINGCPRTPAVHKYVFSRLKGAAFAKMLKDSKSKRGDKILFVSGVYAKESSKRGKIKEVTSRQGKSNAVWSNICFEWSKPDFVKYRMVYDLPENPFYEKGKGSGDCNCNWGDFLTYDELMEISPKLARGNVRIVDKISRENHGYGWNSKDGCINNLSQNVQSESLSEDYPFLCEGCSRSSNKENNTFIENEMKLRLIDWSS